MFNFFKTERVAIFEKQKTTSKTDGFKLNAISIGTTSNQKGVILLTTLFLLFTFATVDSFSLAPSPGKWERAGCANPLPKNEGCGRCPNGTRPPGSGHITCEWGESLFDGLLSDLGNIRPGEQYITNVFFPSDEGFDTITKKGAGYIGAKADYYFWSELLEEFIYSYITCDAIKIQGYDAWYEAATYVQNDSNYVEGKVLVYPNPTMGNAFLKLNSNFIINSNVESVSYELYNSGQTLLTTLIPLNVTNVVEIPDNYISNNGTYFVKCHITKSNGALNEVITLSFVVGK